VPCLNTYFAYQASTSSHTSDTTDLQDKPIMSEMIETLLVFISVRLLTLPVLPPPQSSLLPRPPYSNRPLYSPLVLPPTKMLNTVDLNI